MDRIGMFNGWIAGNKGECWMDGWMDRCRDTWMNEPTFVQHCVAPGYLIIVQLLC